LPKHLTVLHTRSGSRDPPSSGASMSKPAVILVGADKGGVGKTMVTRTLLDYFDARNVRRRAFDTEHPRGTLERFHPGITDVVDITSVADQMRIFDTINSSGVTVVDIRAGLLSSTLQALDDIGFVEASRNGQLVLGIVHILGPSIASLDEINEVAPYITDGGYFLVKIISTTRHSSIGIRQRRIRTLNKPRGRNPLVFRTSMRWRVNRSRLLPFHSPRSSPTRRQMEKMAHTPLCCADTRDTG
jgi:hypothetical protein